MNILVLNLGMKSIRSIIFDDEGRKLSVSQKTIETAINDRKVEQDPDEWWEKGRQAITESIKDAGITSIDYITVTTSASTLVCADEKGNAVLPAIMVSDKRAQKEAKEMRESEEGRKAIQETGLDITSSLLLPKILWIKRNKESQYKKVRHFLTSNDYLINKLSGKVITDYLNATKLHYSIKKGRYETLLLARYGIDKALFPEVKETGMEAGELLPELKQEFGIKGKTKVILTSYDAICSFIGSGASEEGDASDVSGTVTVFRVLSNKKKIKKSEKIYITPFHQENINIIGGSNNLGGGLIEWVKQCYYLKEEYPYEVMEKEAMESEIGAGGIIFLPYLLGERAPLWNDSARGVFFGLERMHTRKDMTRAVLESSAYIDRTFIEAVEETGVKVKRVKLSGGLARLNTVSQIKADVLGREVEVLSEFETTSTGAAMMVLQAQEGISFKELSERFARVRMIIRPDMNNHNKYLVMYDLFKEVYETNKKLFDRRIKLLDSIRSERETQIENL